MLKKTESSLSELVERKTKIEDETRNLQRERKQILAVIKATNKLLGNGGERPKPKRTRKKSVSASTSE